ncbi:ABC transporter permease [Clostridium sp. AM27-31LB]|jgi:putative ABC transport system permease protein|uniref:FtsX-like permease family protein n=1 Tax=Clostridium sp. AM27-31LB TaxID=2293026 RepID=UPI000E515AC2|nr:ABC transporter permease [Clostridium sp. AM27-31LB]RHT93328.1 ABC transporter permease [Clostridium sp. AM27-31LB]
MGKLYFKLAKTNLSNNKPFYIPYIISSIITVAMLYMMSFLSDNKGLNKIMGADSLATIFRLGVGIIVIFSYIFLFYTNSFIIKRRKKEIGVYNILGMEKRHLSKVLFVETIYSAIISLVCGIIVGIAFSKFILMVLYGIIGIHKTVEFFVNIHGIILCVVSFGILFLLTFLYNFMQIKLANPIELLRGTNVGEREPKTKIFMTIVGVVCLAIAYYIAITTENPLNVLTLFFVAVLLVIIGTFALFTAGSIALLKLLRNNKKFYYNKRHFMAVSGMLYRMKQNAAGLASICILSTMVLVVISTTVSMYVGIQDELMARYPNDVCVTVDYNSVIDKSSEIEKAIFDEIDSAEVKNKKAFSYLSVFVGQKGDDFTTDKEHLSYQNSYLFYILSKDDFIKKDSSFKDKIGNISKGEAVVVLNKKYDKKDIKIFGKNYKVNKSFEHTEDNDLYMISTLNGLGYIILDNDESVQELYDMQEKMLGKGANYYTNKIRFDFKSGNKKQKAAAYKKIDNVVKKYFKENKNDKKEISSYWVESRQENEQNFYLLYGGLFFLGIFLGTMFLIVTVMIIFYKQITEGYDDRERYQILEKVGMSSREVKDTIKSQIRIVFVLPIFAAAVHVTAAFPMVNRILKMLNLNNEKLFAGCLAATIIVFAVIYYLVFKVTSRAYYKIVK